MEKKMNVQKLTANLTLLSLIFLFGSVNAQSLPKNSPEINQLTAMGYEVDKDTIGEGSWTIANNGSNKIVLSKSEDRLAVMRVFTRKKLSAAKENELLQLINQINIDLSYQTMIQDESLSFVLYDYGSHNPKTFLKMVRIIEKVDSVFDAYPTLLKLLN